MSTPEQAAPAAPPRRMLRPPPLGLRLGIVLSLLFLLIGFVSISWTPYPLEPAGIPDQLLDPSAAHWLGTDQQGRDLLSLVMKGTLTSFVVAAVAVAIGLLFGLPLGFAAAAWGRRANVAGDALLLFPAVVIAILVAARLGPGAVSAMIAIGIAQAGVFARVTGKAAALLGRRPYVDAARLAGMNVWDSATRHVAPALSRLLLVQVVIQLAVGVLAEATLAYVGLGTQPPGTSLGLMLREAQSLMLFEPLLLLVPGTALAAIALSLSLVAHGLAKWLGVDHAAA